MGCFVKWKENFCGGGDVGPGGVVCSGEQTFLRNFLKNLHLHLLYLPPYLFRKTMKTIHIYLSDELYERMNYFIKTEGFKGRSEFVRFMIKYFEYLPPTPKKTFVDVFRVGRPYNVTPPAPEVKEAQRGKYFSFYPHQPPRPPVPPSLPSSVRPSAPPSAPPSNQHFS